jgi:large conductance mechanosensitive channel protein
MLKGFKDFLFRGNVIDLSVAVVIGAAFTDVVTAVTNSFLKPLIQLLSPENVGEIAGTIRVDGVVFDYATVINQTITFVITAAVVYFCVVAPMKAIQTRRLRGEESGPAQPTDVELLTEIRDLMLSQATAGSAAGGAVGAAVDRDDQIAVGPRSPVDPIPAAVGADAVGTSPVLPPTQVGAPAMPRWTRSPADGAPMPPTRPAPPRSAPPAYAEAPAGPPVHAPESRSRHSRAG